MDLSDLPQFTVDAIRQDPNSAETVLVGRLSHLRGVRDTTAWLYRAPTTSMIGTIDQQPASVGEPIEFRTLDTALAPELRVGVTYPWIDGTWQPYQVGMILAGQWQERLFADEAARYFELGGVTGWQPVDVPMLEGAKDLGIRPAAWDHEHCDLCGVRIGGGEDARGFVDPEDRWLCGACYQQYAVNQDLSFVAEA